MDFIVWIFVAIVFYYTYRFVQVLMRMRQDIVLPVTVDEMASIRREPQKTVKAPNYSSQKAGIIFYILVLIYIIGMLFLVWQFRNDVVFLLYFLVMFPIFHLSNFLNLFAVTKDGILCGDCFASWKSIKSFEFVRIDITHNYYGFSSEVNDQYELRLKTRFRTLSCIVTTEEMKERLGDLMGEREVKAQ
ncbi:hypothetical protein [Oceanobacillus saliphilus]|uniref:hypothetical protein n=1 Tax=Oceanobacillus saliphilus TaxID=2925834 RepID=UPI00201E7336|nr:hypothetical protein [Oceanobacillus saliphilus]